MGFIMKFVSLRPSFWKNLAYYISKYVCICMIYTGFVPATEDDTAEEKEGTEETTEKRYKFHPYYGFVEKTTEEEEEPKEEQMYKFVPYYGFVPVNKDGESEMEQKSEDGDDQQHQFTYSFHPYYGYLPTLVKKGDADVAEEQFYKLDPDRTSDCLN